MYQITGSPHGTLLRGFRRFITRRCVSRIITATVSLTDDGVLTTLVGMVGYITAIA